jgi:hypothetical protein
MNNDFARQGIHINRNIRNPTIPKPRRGFTSFFIVETLHATSLRRLWVVEGGDKNPQYKGENPM